MAFIFKACAVLLALLAAGDRHTKGDPFGPDPFGAMLPPMQLNPEVQEAQRNTMQPALLVPM